VALPLSGARVAMDPGKLLRVMGPANIVVEKGRVKVLGIEYGPGSRILVHRLRSYVVKAVERSVLSVSMGEGASIEEPAPGEEVVDEWERIANEIVSSGSFVAMVTGPVDSGKTSLSTMIANVALSRGLKTAIVDLDVGQGDLAPPTFIAMKVLEEPVTWLRLLKGDSYRFVGHITPVHNPYYTRFILGARELVEEARERGCSAIVVNTCGWVTGLSAIEMLVEIAYIVRATHVVALDDALYERLSNALAPRARVVRAPRPRVVRERNRVDRRMLRRHQYMRFFQNAKRVCLDVSKLLVLGSCCLSGRRLSADALPEELRSALSRYVVYEHDDAVVLWSRREVPADLLTRIRSSIGKEVYVVTPSTAKGLLCAVLDGSMRVAAPALIDSVDLDRGEICIVSEYRGEVSGLIIGRVKISESWDEISRLPRCPL